MKALAIPVEGPIEVVDLDGSLGQLQEIVGGLIQALPVPDFICPDGRCSVYVNEEGKFDPAILFNGRATDFLVPGVGLMYGDWIAGTMLVAGFNPRKGEHAQLPASVAKRVRLIEREAS